MKVPHDLLHPYARRTAQVTAAHRRQRQHQQATVLEHYGKRCCCCGTDESVSVGPVVDDLRTKPRLMGLPDKTPLRAGQFNAWLIRQGLPDGFETRCLPCYRRGRGPYGCDDEAHLIATMTPQQRTQHLKDTTYGWARSEA